MSALASLLCACYSTPSPRYYALGAGPPAPGLKIAGAGSAATAPAVTAGGSTVVVDVVAIPAAVDRPQFVLSGEGNEVSIDDDHRWAGPLQSSVAEVLARDLMGSEKPGASSARYRVEVEILAFESRLDEDVRLEATWKIRRDDGASSSGLSRVREPAPGRDFSALAAAHSRAISRLANEIALAIRDLDTQHPSQHS